MAERVAALDERLVEVEAKEAAGKFAEGLAVANAVVTEASLLGYEPLQARAWISQGTLRIQLGEFEDAVTSLERVYDVAVAQAPGGGVTHGTRVGAGGDQAAVIVAFYDDYDANQDGTVGWIEWGVDKLSPVSVKNSAVTEVAMAARYDPRVLRMDPSFAQEAADMFLDFAAGLVADGLYSAYFSRGVSSVIKPIAGRITSNVVARYVISKKLSKAVKKLYDDAVKP